MQFLDSNTINYNQLEKEGKIPVSINNDFSIESIRIVTLN